MKKMKFFVLPLLIIMITVTACKDDFLEVPPTGSLSSTELSSQAGLEGSLIASYSMLLGRNGFFSDASNWFWGSVLGGDANKGTNAGDQSQANEIQSYSSQTNNSSILQKYSTNYEGIARCNATLALAALADEVNADVKTRIEAEARFLRGHYYFDLKKNFNDVPYVDEKWNGNDPNGIGIDPVPNNIDLWGPIEADLKFAMDNLPETQPDKGRANKWAAAAYYGKALLFQGKFAEAKTVLADVVANGVTADGTPYALNSSYADAFRSTNDNSAESVFASQAAAGTGSIENANPAMVLNFPHGSAGPPRPGGCCGFFQPSFDLANSFRTDANGLPFLDGSYNDPANALNDDMGIGGSQLWDPTATYGEGNLVSVFDPAAPNTELVYSSNADDNTGNDPLTSSNWTLEWQEDDQSPLDPRLDHSVGRKGIPYLDWGPHPGFDWIRDQAYAGPYSPKKFIYYAGGDGTENDGTSWTPGYTAVNYNIIRFADVLLMLAEAEIESNGDLENARTLINRVRQRAIDSPVRNNDGTPAANYGAEVYTSLNDQSTARAALRMERKLELSGEGHRFYDLRRWGIQAEVLNAYLAHENPKLSSPFSGASFDTGKDEFLPIPQNEIDLLGADVLIQNPGY
ncbi:MAG: RagB/SusD family nutrient uptake outer membrane protein, partial [Bacteroidota bacterium]